MPGCLRSLETAVDEIVIVDTGSTDSTPAIAAAAGAKLIFADWKDDFSAARNEAVKHATGDWILTIDADERLMWGHGQLVRQICDRADPDIWGLGMYCYSPALDGTVTYPILECKWDIDMGTLVSHPLMRIHRNLPEIVWENRAHENFSESVKRQGKRCVNTPISIWHEGYRESYVKATEKLERNRRIQEMDVAEKPDDPWVRYNLGRTYAAMGLLDKADAEFRWAAEHADPEAPWRPVMLRDWKNLQTRVPAGASA